MNYKEGDRVAIKIDGREFDTIIKGDTQKFVTNNIIKYLWSKSKVSFGELWEMVELEMFSKADLMGFYRLIGWPVDEYCDAFGKGITAIDNPCKKEGNHG